MDKLKETLLNDLTKRGLDISTVDLIIKEFSSSYYGRYYPSVNSSVKPRIIIYPFKTKDLVEMYDYGDILNTVIHEFCHHLQYMNPNFVRKRGIMHDTEFWNLYNNYTEVRCEKIC